MSVERYICMVSTIPSPNMYSYNPYVSQGVFNPQSQIVVPNGQPYAQPQLQAVATAQVPANATPYINPNSPVFSPQVQATSGLTINTPVIQDIAMQNAQIVYQGPVKSVNPQITPIEQVDNQVDKDFKQYCKNKAQYNEEFRKVLESHNSGSSLVSKLAKALGVIIVVGALYKYGNKIPIVKNIIPKIKNMFK